MNIISRQGLTVMQDHAENRGYKWSLNIQAATFGASSEHAVAWKQEILKAEYGISIPNTSSDVWHPTPAEALTIGAESYDKYVEYLVKIADLESQGMRLDYGKATNWEQVFIPAKKEE